MYLEKPTFKCIENIEVKFTYLFVIHGITPID